MGKRSIEQDEGRSPIPRDVWWLVIPISAVLLLESMFFTALAPLLPHYVEELGISEAQAGMLAGSEAAGTFLVALPAGLAASRWGYKRTLLLAAALIGVCAAAFGLARELWLLDLLRFAQGCASATAWTAAIAWLVSASPPDRRGQLLGAALGAAATGSLIGPLLGGVAAEIGTGPAFAGAGLLFFPLLAVVAALPTPRQAEAQPIRLALGFARHARVRIAYWLVLLAALLIGSLAVIVPLELADLGWRASAISAAFVVGAALEVAANLLVGRWSDRHGRRLPVLGALAALGGLLLVLPLLGRPLPLAVLLVLATAALGALSVSAMTLLSKGAEAAKLDRGLSLSLMNVGWAPGHAAGSLLSGMLIERGSILVACLMPAALCLGTLAALRSRAAGRTLL